jgi:hypothetical protein
MGGSGTAIREGGTVSNHTSGARRAGMMERRPNNIGEQARDGLALVKFFSAARPDDLLLYREYRKLYNSYLVVCAIKRRDAC